MPYELMSEALEQFLRKRPPLDSLPRWDEAVHDAFRLSPLPEAEPLGTRLGWWFIELRKQTTRELVSFDRELKATPYQGSNASCPDGYSPWQVDIPLTVFPVRDQGFARIDCVVVFSTDEERPDAVRVLALSPEAGAEVKAHSELRGSLQLDTLKRVGLWVPLPAARLTSEVAVELYRGTNAGPLIHEAVRRCVEAEVLEGTGVRWRLEGPARDQKLGAESHQFSAVLAVKEGTPSIHAAGGVWASSEEDWLQASVGVILRSFDSSVREFLKRGAPAEGYGEWKDVIGRNLHR